MSKEPTAVLRVGRKRNMIAPTEPDFEPVVGTSPETADVVLPGGREAREPVDPAQLAGLIMLEAGLAAAGLTIADVTAPGAITLVLTPGATWVTHVRRAWAAEISGKDSTQKAAISYSFYAKPRTVTFEASEAAKQHEVENAAEALALSVAFRLCIVGISPDPSWLPGDLVAAVDHRLVLAPLSPAGVAELARRLTGVEPTMPVSVTDAAAVTPRLTRLAARPAQSGDDYLRKLLALVDADRAAAEAAPTPVVPLSNLRDVPTLDRLHGLDDAVAWGLQLRDDLAAFKARTRAWADVDRGLLLSGPPGTGKTVFARALAATCGVELVSGSYGAWLATGTGHQGDLLKAMRKAFSQAKDNAPAILFIDEIDAFGDRAKVKHYPEWHMEVVNTLLAEIDGVESHEGIVVVGACNHPHRLDPALMRSGRLDRHIAIGLPDPAALARILREHVGETELPGQDLKRLGLLLLGLTGADVERLVRGARRLARDAGRAMREEDILAVAGATDRRSPDDLRLCAVHEAGHAVAATALGLHVEGLSICDTGARSGFTRVVSHPLYLNDDDVQDHVIALLSGRAAEEVLLGRVTSGAGGGSGSDLHRATWLAVSAAAELGLDRTHGLTWTPLPDREAELTATLAADVRLAALVRQRLARAYGDALAIVRRSAALVTAVADALLERRALDGAEVHRLIEAGGDRS